MEVVINFKVTFFKETNLLNKASYDRIYLIFYWRMRIIGGNET